MLKYKIEVKGSRIKIEVPPPIEEKSSGGIIVHMDEKQEDGETGVVVQKGHLAYANFEQTGSWCNLGDRVLFQRYAGKPIEEMHADGSLHYYRIIKDIDVIGVLTEVKVGETV